MSISKFIFRLVVLALLFVGLYFPIGGSLRLGPVLDPHNGVWGAARAAAPHASGSLFIDGMSASVTVEYDDRGVPHLYASTDRDATIALGFIVARDRLFQMDFIHRVATGTLAELMGEAAVGTDLFFRKNGIADAVQRNSELLKSRLPREAEAVSWYGIGVDAYLDQMSPSDIPLEYRLLDAEPPSRFSTSFTMALFAYMTYDLSFSNQDIRIESVRNALSPVDFARLYPLNGKFERTIVQEGEEFWETGRANKLAGRRPVGSEDLRTESTPSTSAAQKETNFNAGPALAEGFFEGKGSNNWAVGGSRSTTGMPILAGDMHLSLSLPAVWYEAHLVTPTANVYGVTFPSVPGIVEGITPTTAWAFTNTGSDQIDTYRMKLNADRTSYLYDDEWQPLTVITDTIHVKGGNDVIQTRLQSHLGPVLENDPEVFAIKWVGHGFGSTFAAIWDMNRARNYTEFEQAIRKWDYPMQNILYAGADSVIAIRSTGYMPIRADGEAFGIRDGTTSATAWTGRVPFEELPHVIAPERGFLTSTNQDPTPPGYPYYMDRDWRSVYRSRRIFDLLIGSEQHSPEDIMRYQSDVKSVQAELFLPLLSTAGPKTPAGERLKEALLGFDGVMSIESREARLFAWFMEELYDLTWDESVFDNGQRPKDIRILELAESGDNTWFDIEATPEVETLADVVSLALERAGARWESEEFSLPTWGEQHTLVVRHISRSQALKPLWRGPYPFPGYAETLSPAASSPTYWSASWRVVVDFSTSPPAAFGIYPGGQSGNPFSANYDAHLQKYVAFEYYPLNLSGTPSGSKN